MLTATLARMHSAWIPRFGGTRAAQRSRVVLLGLALCLWLIAFATHFHSDKADSSSIEPSHACTFCLSLPSGAPAPAQVATPSVFFVATDTIIEVVAAFVAIDAPSFYLSRGPPTP